VPCPVRPLRSGAGVAPTHALDRSCSVRPLWRLQVNTVGAKPSVRPVVCAAPRGVTVLFSRSRSAKGPTASVHRTRYQSTPAPVRKRERAARCFHSALDRTSPVYESLVRASLTLNATRTLSEAALAPGEAPTAVVGHANCIRRAMTRIARVDEALNRRLILRARARGRASGNSQSCSLRQHQS
jgi:hypothetical protein